ncbi:hypothetical protein CALVIDRAFT_137509 [Calocera viscosa TUFC12733]|uniref:Uncharacterized protein n=1 Tax=Calocera viscosa (strain TUFC12733) TaxID=1330018 RepID=A0A167LZU3_CALVF|nr:hypothetical protein CALVIDRAFT_137509 [Calocera viscosa TUFC12733]
MDCTIEPNSEIAGIGIRVSIYVQAILAFLLATLALFKFAVESEMTTLSQQLEGRNIEDVDPTREEIEYLLKSDLPLRKVIKRLQRRYLRDELEGNRDLRQARMSVQLTGVALLVSAVIQAQLYSLDVYHAFIVLNLCWINNITALTLYLTEQFLRRPRENFLLYPLPPRFWTWKGMQAANPFLPTSAYLCGLGCYGFWLFFGLNTFGDEDWNSEACNPLVLYWILGNHISVTARGFRIVGLVIHAVAFTPLLNVIIESFLLCNGARHIRWVFIFSYKLYKKATGRELNVEEHVIAPQYRNVHFLETLTAIAIMYTYVVICFILSTEEMIGANWPLINNDEENEWTFGQSLVMILLIPVIWDLFDKSRDMYYLWKEKKAEDREVEMAVLNLRAERERQKKERSNSVETMNGDVGLGDGRHREKGARAITHSQGSLLVSTVKKI